MPTSVRRKPKATPATRLLRSIKKRERKQTEFNYGITVADRYVRTVEQAIGLSSCYKYASRKSTSYNDVVRKASRTLVYSNLDMEVLEADRSKAVKDLDGIELPKNTLMVFQHVLTTPRKDRDGDILRTQGASVDPNMLLLWQHIPTLPIGKMLSIVEHNSKRLVLTSAIIDMGELAHDAAVMIDNKMGRFSHGFNVREYEELKEADDDGMYCGFDIKKFEILEESLVSIPSNVDAEVLDTMLSLVEGGKLHSPIMKQYGKNLRSLVPASVVAGIDLKKESGDVDQPGSGSEASGEQKAAEAPAPEEAEEDAGEAAKGADAEVAEPVAELEKEVEAADTESAIEEKAVEEKTSEEPVEEKQTRDVSVVEAMGIFLGQSTLEQKTQMMCILKAMFESARQDDIAKEFRSFLNGDALRRS